MRIGENAVNGRKNGLLEEFDSIGLAISLPNFLESADSIGPDHGDHRHSAEHDDRLYSVGPHHGFQATLEKEKEEEESLRLDAAVVVVILLTRVV